MYVEALEKQQVVSSGNIAKARRCDIAFIQKQDTDGTKATLLKGELGYDDYTAGGDTGRVYVSDGTTNIPLSKKGEVDTALALKSPLASPTFTGTVTVSNISGVTKTMVGLSDADNTSDANKPLSSATQTALDLKANLASPTFTGTVSGVTKAMVGLSSVDNTSDISKPVSTAQQTALNLKANLASPTLTGTVTLPTTTSIGSVSSTEIGYVNGVTSAIQTQLGTKANLASPALTGVPTAPTASAGTNTTQLATTAFAKLASQTGYDNGKSLTTNGYQKFAGGFIMQWGQLTHSADTQAVSFPIAFPTACLQVTATLGNAAVLNADVAVTAFNTTTATLYNDGGTSGYITRWMAIGH